MVKLPAGVMRPVDPTRCNASKVPGANTPAQATHD
jgi:hypothetical protein